MADQLNKEGIKPVYSKKGWYSAFIDGLLDSTVVVGRPAWNRTTQASFRRKVGGKIVDANDDSKGHWIGVSVSPCTSRRICAMGSG